MALDFPSSPVVGQTFNNYVWNGTAWAAQGSTNNVGTQIAALQTASPITVASQAARNALYPNPVQGNSVWRSDLGTIETYYGLYNSSTNVGGATPAGWYPTVAYGIAHRKNTATYTLTGGVYNNVSNSAYWDTHQTAGGVAAYSGGWTIPFAGLWKISFHVVGLPASTILAGWRVNNTAAPGSWSSVYGAVQFPVGVNSGSGGTVIRKFAAGDVLTMFMYSSSSAANWPTELTVDSGSWEIEFVGPAK